MAMQLYIWENLKRHEDDDDDDVIQHTSNFILYLLSKSVKVNFSASCETDLGLGNLSTKVERKMWVNHHKK